MKDDYGERDLAEKMVKPGPNQIARNKREAGGAGGSPTVKQILRNQHEAQTRRRKLNQTIGPKAARRKYGKDYGS